MSRSHSLAFDQLSKRPLLGHQILKRPLLDNSTLIEHHHLIGAFDGGQPMGDD